MLVLSRKLGESVKIGADIIVSVVAVAGNRVKIGIEAPPDVVVLREEMLPQQTTPPRRFETSARFKS